MARPTRPSPKAGTSFGRFFRRATTCACAALLGACSAATAPTGSATGTATPPAVATQGAAGSPATSQKTAAPAPTPEFEATTAPATAAPEGAVTVEMTGPPPHYVPKNVTAQAGRPTFFLTNTSLAFHNLAIDRARLVLVDGRVKNVPLVVSGTVAVGKSAAFVVDGLIPGDYFIWCTLGDHAFLGMTGTLTVTP